MRLTLTDEQQMIQTMAREFAESEIKPVAEELDREERFPHETVKRLGELGMMGMTIPERWGGSGADAVSLILAIIELAKQCASHAVILTVNNSLFCEPDRTEERNGITALLVDKGTPGFSVPRTEEKLGIRASDTAEFLFEDCRVPVANRLGEEGQGFKIALATLASSRIGIAAQGVGIASGAYERSVAYARERKTFGVPIGQHQMIQWMLADMATTIEGARLLTLRAAALKDAGRPYVKAASMAKYFAAETAMKVTTDAIQVHGGYGYTREYQVERFFRDAKITQIYEGTSQIQKLVIAREVLGGDA